MRSGRHSRYVARLRRRRRESGKSVERKRHSSEGGPDERSSSRHLDLLQFGLLQSFGLGSTILEPNFNLDTSTMMLLQLCCATRVLYEMVLVDIAHLVVTVSSTINSLRIIAWDTETGDGALSRGKIMCIIQVFVTFNRCWVTLSNNTKLFISINWTYTYYDL